MGAEQGAATRRSRELAIKLQHRTSKTTEFPSNHGSQRFEPPKRQKREREEANGVALIDRHEE
jgi:hypothetical protein